MFVDGSSIGVWGRSECEEVVDAVEMVSSVEIRGGCPEPEPEEWGGAPGSGAFRLKTLDILLLIDPRVEMQSASPGGVR